MSLFVIEAVNARGWRWISAICGERQRALDFLATVPPHLHGLQRLIEVPGHDYPLCIIEKQGFEYGDVALVHQRLSELRPAAPGDDVLMNVYIAPEDFLPAHPGKDCMGHLCHWHITGDSLRSPQTERMLEELAGAG